MFKVLVLAYFVLTNVLQLDKDYLGVVAHDAGDEGGPDLDPLQGQVGPREDNKGPGAGLHGHGDRVVDGGGGGEVPLVETQSVARVSVLKIGSKVLLHKLSVSNGIAAIYWIVLKFYNSYTLSGAVTL